MHATTHTMVKLSLLERQHLATVESGIDGHTVNSPKCCRAETPASSVACTRNAYRPLGRKSIMIPTKSRSYRFGPCSKL